MIKEWTIHFDNSEETLTVFAESFEKYWHNESAGWYWKFSDGSMIDSIHVKAIINDTEPEIEKNQ
jgi:hypothetical protein